MREDSQNWLQITGHDITPTHVSPMLLAEQAKDLLRAFSENGIKPGESGSRLEKRRKALESIRETDSEAFYKAVAKLCGAVSTLLIDRVEDSVDTPLAISIKLEKFRRTLLPLRENLDFQEFSVLDGLIQANHLRQDELLIDLISAYGEACHFENTHDQNDKKINTALSAFHDRVRAHDETQNGGRLVALSAAATALQDIGTKNILFALETGPALNGIITFCKTALEHELDPSKLGERKVDRKNRRRPKDPEALRDVLQPAYAFWSECVISSQSTEKTDRIHSTLLKAESALRGQSVADLAEACSLFLNIKKWAIQKSIVCKDGTSPLADGLPLIEAIKQALRATPKQEASRKP